MMILVAGPYRSGTDDDPGRMADNLATLEAATLPLFRAGHIPVIGEWLALPLLRQAGSMRASKGADEDVRRARELGLPVFTRLQDIPSDQP